MGCCDVCCYIVTGHLPGFCSLPRRPPSLSSHRNFWAQPLHHRVGHAAPICCFSLRMPASLILLSFRLYYSSCRPSTIKWAMLDHLQHTPEYFKDVIQQHFRCVLACSFQSDVMFAANW